MIRVVIADDQHLVRAGFATLVDNEPDMAVAGQAATGAEAIAACRREPPDIVLMDIRMPDIDGIEATRVIASDRRLDRTRIIVLTTFSLDEYVVNAVRAGASAFLLKDTLPSDLLTAIRTVHQGDALLAPAVTRTVIEAAVATNGATTDATLIDALTARERDVVQRVAEGMNNAEVGAALHISPLTAKTHVSSALSKLGLRDRSQLVVIAYESGLVRPTGTKLQP